MRVSSDKAVWYGFILLFLVVLYVIVSIVNNWIVEIFLLIAIMTYFYGLSRVRYIIDLNKNIVVIPILFWIKRVTIPFKNIIALKYHSLYPPAFDLASLTYTNDVGDTKSMSLSTLISGQFWLMLAKNSPASVQIDPELLIIANTDLKNIAQKQSFAKTAIRMFVALLLMLLVPLLVVILIHFTGS